MSLTDTATYTFTATASFTVTQTNTVTHSATRTPTATPTLPAATLTPTNTPSSAGGVVVKIIYPNPARDRVKLLLSGCKVKVKIYTVSFRKIYSVEMSNPDCASDFTATVDVSGFSRGVYHLYAENESGAKSLKELIKL
jgi:hypothetical protein